MKNITIEKVILFLAAGFAAYNYGLAGGYIERGSGLSIGGVAAGIVVNVSLAIAASRFGSLKGDKRTKQAQIAFVVMLVISPMLVSPVIFYSLPDTFMAIPHVDIWWANILATMPRILWSLAWPLVADLAIVLAGAVSGKGLIALSEPTAAQSETSADGSAPNADAVRKNKKRSADAVREECAALSAQYACTEPECGWSPDVDALIESARAGKSARSSAASAKAGHAKNKHPKPILAEALFGAQEKK
jgi:hypothetical protein